MISVPGIGSNLDVNSIVSQLIALESRPLTQLAAREASFQSRISAFGSLKGAISALQSSLSGLRNLSRFESFNAQTGNAAIITAAAGSSAAAGNFAVNVSTLAQPHVVQTAGIASPTAASSTGSITLQAGSGAIHAITIDSSNNTLAGVRDAINAAQTDVRAVIINDGTANPYRLVLTAAEGGSANTISVSNSLTAGDLKSALDGITTAQPAANAAVTINGVAISGAGNTLTEAIPGVTLQLTGTGSTTLTVARDTNAIQSAVQGFVKAYNDLNKVISDLTAVDPAAGRAGALAGNSGALGIQSQLRATLGSALSGLSGNFTNLSAIGVAFQRDGSLALDATKLSAAIAAAPDDIGALFALRAKPDSALLSLVRSDANVSIGAYEVHVTAAATRGTATAPNVPAASTVIDATNDGFSFTLDNVASGTLSIAHGTYTATELAAALQTAIDSSAALDTAGATATVAVESGNIVIRSDRYGATSGISALGGSALAALGYAGSETGSGTDIAGSFVRNGVTIAATGLGQELTSNTGTTGTNLTVLYTGDASQLQTGAEATLNLSEGYAVLLDRLATQLLATNGPLSSRTEGLNRSIQDIGRQREVLNRRIADTETRLRAQFTALDTLIARLTTTSTFLTQQLANLPSISNSN